MSSLSSDMGSYGSPVPVSPFSYREVAQIGFFSNEEPQSLVSSLPKEEPLNAAFTQNEVDQLLADARLQAATETELRLNKEFEAKFSCELLRIGQTVDLFAAQRKRYFARVESEVVHLALAIAAKILHRETQADPMLIAAMVRIALDQLQESSKISLRVPLGEMEKWKSYMISPPHGITPEIIGDPSLSASHCILQADLGSIDFSIDAQLKDVEQGFLDLLAHRPALQ